MDDTELRNEMRAFYQDGGSQWTKCKDESQNASLKKMEEGFEAIAAAHPEYNAMRMRKEMYPVITAEFRPVIFRNTPFYFEAGINGGWGCCPGRWLQNHFTEPVFKRNIPQEDLDRYHARCRQSYILCCGPYVDSVHHLPPVTRILTDGFKGVYEETLAALPRCKTAEEREFIEAALAGLTAIHEIQLKFAGEAKKILDSGELAGQQRKFMSMIADSAKRCPWEPPATFYEGLNMFWFLREILALVDGLSQFSIGHPDAMLIELYRKDLAESRLTKEEAYDLICRFLQIADCHYDGFSEVHGYGDHELEIPLTLGGCDENGNEICNELTFFFLKAHRECGLVFPKLHCRCSENSPHEYLHAIAQDVYEGRCVHSLFNDDAVIRSLTKQGKTLREARRYICTGCWDGLVDSVENVDTANYFSLARILEATIYPDPEKEKEAQIQLERIDGCTSFEEVRDILYRNILRFLRSVLNDYTKYGALYSNISPHPAYSACMEGCLASLKDESAGGAKYKQRVIVLAFLANLIDSLAAVKTLCFDRKTCTAGELLEAVRNNWKGAENLRNEVLKAPCWGDDSETTTALARYFLDGFLRDTADLKNERGGPYTYSIWIYREYRYWGEKMRALPDGRHDGDYLSQALNPSHFRNQEEITTTLNAIGRLDYSNFLSTNTNLMFDREHATPEILEALFRTFAAKGLQLLQPNCCSLKELLDAQKHPENHPNLIVKVCGFSARFVALEPAWQEEILKRKRY